MTKNMTEYYDRELFEQQTPYLQWLRDQTNIIPKGNGITAETGKQIQVLPYFSCGDTCMKESMLLEETELVLWIGAEGYPSENIKEVVSNYFAQNTDVAIAYADEDYLGGLQELYGENVKEDRIAKEYQFLDTGKYRGFPWFKPDYSPDTLMAFFYFGHVFAMKRELLCQTLRVLEEEQKKEQKKEEFCIYELVLCAVQLAKEQGWKVGHISQVLYTNKDLSTSELLEGAQKEFDSMKQRTLVRKGIAIKKQVQEMHAEMKCAVNSEMKNEINLANVQNNEKIHMLCYPIPERALVSIIIPSKDNSQVLFRCLHTLFTVTKLTDDQEIEVILMDNGSEKEEQMCIKEFLSQCRQQVPQISMQYLYCPMPFNFSAMCNLGARSARGDYLLFLNDDMEIQEPDWLINMLRRAALPHVGAVGAKLLYPDDETAGQQTSLTSLNGEKWYHRIQHVGITNMGIGPAHKLGGRYDVGNLYHGHNLVDYDMIAVTAACLMVKKERFWEVNGFDESLAVAYNDVEFCFKLYEAGYYNIQCNQAVLLHHESLSRGQDDSVEKKARLEKEKKLLYEKHPNIANKTDPFYSEHLVQWRKDINYMCNYIYPYEKQVLLKELTQKEQKMLPKEHYNKLLRKLTGENRAMLQIDSVEVEDNLLLVKGWYVLREADNGSLQRVLLLRNKATGLIYATELMPVFRPDVEKLFERKGRTALSGIHVLVQTNKIPCGTYEIGVLVKSKSGRAMVCWSHEEGNTEVFIK